MDPYSRHDPRRDESGSSFPVGIAALTPGLILVGIGALFLLGNLGLVHVSTWLAYWPVILIALGMVKLVDSVTPAGRVLGGILLGVGGLILAGNLGFLQFRVEDLWPLILIGAGLMLLWQRLQGGPSTWDRRYRSRWWMHERFDHGVPFGGALQDFAIFSGSRRVVTDQDFKGGRIHCMFGGINLDLTQANMTGATAVLVISALWGGAQVRIPANWNLEIRAGGVFGGFSDQTVHPAPGPDVKHLIVRGAAVFGGVSFKN